jgi:hypothetical protein
MVELLDLSKTDVHLRSVQPLAFGQKLRQAVHGLWTKNNIHIGSPFNDGSPLLTRHATAHAC